MFIGVTNDPSQGISNQHAVITDNLGKSFEKNFITSLLNIKLTYGEKKRIHANLGAFGKVLK